MNNTVPEPGHHCWQILAAGGGAGFQTRQLALQLLFKRLQGETTAPAQKAAEIHAFFIKYSVILGPEITQLSTL